MKVEKGLLRGSDLNDLPTPIPCPKCETNQWQAFRTYLKQKKKRQTSMTEEPLMLFVCAKCKFIQAQKLVVVVVPTIGGVAISTEWIPMAVAPSMKMKDQ